MMKINLIGKKRVQAKGKNVVLIILSAIFGIYALYFLGLSLFLVVRLNQIKRQQTRVTLETVTLSQELTANDALLKDFILSKFILGKIASLNKEKFPYKLYLDQLVSLMPETAVIKNVDFANKGWIAVSVAINEMSSLKTLEQNLRNPELLATTAFSSVYSETVVKERSGIYIAKLQLEINKK